MENAVQIFNNAEFGQVRTVVIGSEPYFVGKDVAEVLGYSNSRKALADHVDDDDKQDGVTIRDTIGRNQNAVCINESGLYALVFGSKLPTAKKFKRWVTHDILPAIRKTGSYTAKPMSQLEIVAYNAQVLVDHEKKLNEIAQRQESQAHELQDMRDVITLSSVSWRKDVASIINSIAQQLGGYEHIRDVRAESYRLLDERMQVNVHTRLTNMRRRMAENGVCKSKRDKLNQLDVIAEDKKLVEGYLAIIKDMAIKNGVAAPERLGA